MRGRLKCDLWMINTDVVRKLSGIGPMPLDQFSEVMFKWRSEGQECYQDQYGNWLDSESECIVPAEYVEPLDAEKQMKRIGSDLIVNIAKNDSTGKSEASLNGARVQSSMGWHNPQVLQTLDHMFVIKPTERIEQIRLDPGGITAYISTK